MTPEEQAKFDAAETAKANAENVAAIARAVAQLPWLHPEDAEAELNKRCTRNEKGEVVFTTDAHTDETPDYCDAPSAAKQLAARRPEWVKKPIAPGSGAQGHQAAKPIGSTLSYKDLIDPKHQSKLAEVMSKRPKEFARLRAAYYEGLS